MESIVTIGRNFYRGNKFGIKTSDKAEILADAYGKDIYQIILVTGGSIILTDGKDHSALLPPQMLCLSYNNPMKKIELTEAKGFSIFFVPDVINNGIFSGSVNPSEAAGTEGRQESFLAERLLIKPFKQGEISNPFHLAVNQVLLDRLTGMYAGLRDQFNIQPNDTWPCRGRSYFLEILMLLQSLYAFEGDCALDFPLPKGQPAIEEAARTMLLRYYDPKFTIRETRKSLGILRFPLLFRKCTGMSAPNYLKKIRLTVASNLLRNTMLPPMDIAFRSGYHSFLKFERDFKKLHVASPSEYRSQFPNPYG